jgi:hypothetical protein
MSRLSSGETGTALTELGDIFKTDTGKALAGPPLVLASLRSAKTDDASGCRRSLVKQDPNNLFYQQLLGVPASRNRICRQPKRSSARILDKQPNTPRSPHIGAGASWNEPAGGRQEALPGQDQQRRQRCRQHAGVGGALRE